MLFLNSRDTTFGLLTVNILVFSLQHSDSTARLIGRVHSITNTDTRYSFSINNLFVIVEDSFTMYVR